MMTCDQIYMARFVMSQPSDGVALECRKERQAVEEAKIRLEEAKIKLEQERTKQEQLEGQTRSVCTTSQ